MAEEPEERDVANLVATIAHELERELEPLTADVCALLIERVEVLNVPEEDVRDLLVASVGSNLATAIDILAHHIPVDQIEVPAAAAYFARRLAQRDIPQEGLLRAYRLGEARFHQWWMRKLDAHHPDVGLLIASLQHTMSVSSAYIDRVSEDLIEIYSEARERWAQRAGASRAAQVRTVLADEELTPDVAEAITGYRMKGPHLGFVVWASIQDSPCKVESAVQAIAETTGRQPLAVLADDQTLWAWVSGAGVGALDPAVVRVELERRALGPKIAIGSPAPGLHGFRASHRQALSAQRVVEIQAEDGAPVIAFSEVAVSTFLSRDLSGARRWVNEVLGGLASDDESMAELRRTVLVYLQTGASLTDAAVRLHLHKNTVRYRLRKAEDVCGGRSINGRRLDVEVALLACEHLGRAVLSPA